MSSADDNGRTTAAGLDQALPSFYVIGPPRTGTTWLHDVLMQHTSLPRNVEETRFFDLRFHRGFNWYLQYFGDPRSAIKPRGEVAPTYFASSRARQRIARAAPNAKVICIFRHPFERVLSLYRLKYADGMVRCSFEDAVLFDPEFLESGKYATHLKAWYRALGSKQVLVTFYEQLRDYPQAYIDTLADFIGIPRFHLSAAEKRIVHASDALTQPRHFLWTRTAVALAEKLKVRHLGKVASALRKSVFGKHVLSGGRPFTRPSPMISGAVLDLFRPEVEGLEAILNVDLSAWKLKDSDFATFPHSRDELLALFSMTCSEGRTT